MTRKSLHSIYRKGHRQFRERQCNVSRYRIPDIDRKEPALHIEDRTPPVQGELVRVHGGRHDDHPRVQNRLLINPLRLEDIVRTCGS